MSTQVDETNRVDEPRQANEYAEVLSRVAEKKEAVIVRRNGADLAAVVPLEYLELALEAAALERAQEISRKIDWDRVVKNCPPPQEYFDRDEPKPF